MSKYIIAACFIFGNAILYATQGYDFSLFFMGICIGYTMTWSVDDLLDWMRPQ